MRRRTLLARLAVLAAPGLAGCIGGPDGEAPTDPEPTDPTDQPTASPSPSPPATDPDSPAPTDTATPGTEADQEVVVGPGGDLRFSPDSFEIGVGDTVRWRFDSGGHNVRPGEIPDDADWPGTEGGDSTTFSGGHTYTYTFEVAGTYEYYCAPHRAAGMTGSFRVG